MNFYEKRSVLEQANRLPLELREKYQSTQLDRIKIDGVEIMGYFEYSFLEEKSYVEQPTRANDGSIQNIDDYVTFLTPRLVIKYNMMGIDDYRTLMTLLNSKNSFMVECYDIVKDKRVTHQMYFAPPSMPIIYQQYLSVLGIREYTIELIGTNANKEVYIRYNFNFPADLYSKFVAQFGNSTPTMKMVQANTVSTTKIGGLKIGNTNTTLEGFAFSNGAYMLDGWVDAETSSKYREGSSHQITKDLMLEAIWN